MNMRGFIVGLLLSISSCFLFSTTISATQADSLWPKNGEYIVNQTQTINSGAINLCTEQIIKTVYYLHLPKSERNTCVYETAYGSYADSGHIKRFVGDYMQLVPSVIPVPNTTKMYARACGTSPCRLIYYDTQQGFSGSNTGSGYKLAPRATSTPVRNPATQQTLNVFSIGFSANGRWLAIETTGGFVRHDTETGNFLKFSNPRGSYGVGQDPSFKYSITDDGRYIVLSGSNYRYATVFDLNTCTGGSATDPIGVLAVCESVELVDVLRGKGYSVGALYGAAFRAGDREITTYGPDSNNKTVGYVIRLDSLQTRADYVALGDSFSSGEGDIRDNTRYLEGSDGTDEFPNEKCHISNRSYPYLLNGPSKIATSFFKIFACSGATTEDVLGRVSAESTDYVGQFFQAKKWSSSDIKIFNKYALEADIAGRTGQYKFIEKYQPKNITITIGGNDAGFGNVVTSCVMAGTCEFESNERAAVGLEMHGKYQVLRDTYRKILRASPDATLYVLSYPQFIDDSDQCNPNVGMNKAERTFVRESVSYFNQVIRQAALAEGATYIDIEDSLTGEALCSPKLLDLAVNGIVNGDDTHMVIANESFHPNARGHEMIAGYIKDTYGSFPNLTGETCPLESCSSYRTPAIPNYFNVSPTTVQRYKSAIIEEFKQIYKAATQVQLKLTSLIPDAVGKVSIHSTPRSLGTIIADTTGTFNAAVTIPSDLEPGYHEIHVETTGPDGTKTSYYQPLTIIGPDDDYDGDGTLNTNDSCLFVETAGIDTDSDGIDDGCDGDMYIAPATAASSQQPTQASSTQPTTLGVARSRSETPIIASLNDQESIVVVGGTPHGQVAGVSDIKMDKQTSILTQDDQQQGVPIEMWIAGLVVSLGLIMAGLFGKLQKN